MAESPTFEPPAGAVGAAAAPVSRQRAEAARPRQNELPKAFLSAAERKAQQAALVNCLRRYVALSERYQGISFDEPCQCGNCLLCRAKAALASLERAP